MFRAVQLKAGKNNVRPPSQRGSEGTPLSVTCSLHTSPHPYRTLHDSTELSEDQAAALPATPLYNLAVLEDMAVLTQHKILQRTVAPSPALAKALVLLKVSPSPSPAAIGYCTHPAWLSLFPPGVADPARPALYCGRLRRALRRPAAGLPASYPPGVRHRRHLSAQRLPDGAHLHRGGPPAAVQARLPLCRPGPA